MRSRTLIGLALLAMLQGGWLLWEQRRGEPSSAASGRVVELDRDHVESIQLQRRTGELLELRRSGERWIITRPIEEQADTEAVESMLSAGEFLESWRFAPERVSAAQLGLDPPTLRLVLVGSGQRRQELRLGATDPSQQGVYLQTNGRRHVVPRSFFEAIDLGLDELRDRSLVHVQRDELRRIVRSGGSPGDSLDLQRDSAGTWWQQAAGARVPVAPEASQRLIGALVALRARRFVPSGREPSGPRTLLRAEAGRAGVAELRLSGPCPGHPAEFVVAARRPRGSAAACVESEDLIALRVPAADLQDRALTHLDEPELARITIRGAGNAKVELRREAGLWQLPGGVPADRQEVRAWLEALRGLQGNARLSSEAVSGRGSIELQRETPAGLEKLSFGADREGGGLLAQRDGMRGSVLVLSAEAGSLLAADPLRFRDRQLWRFSPEEVRVLRSEGEGGTLELRRRDDGWAVIKPPSGSVDSDRLQALLGLLSRLHAEHFLDEKTAPRVRRRAVFRLELDPEPLGASKAPRLRTLELSGDRAHGCWGRIAGAPPFSLDVKDCELLRSPLLRAR